MNTSRYQYTYMYEYIYTHTYVYTYVYGCIHMYISKNQDGHPGIKRVPRLQRVGMMRVCVWPCGWVVVFLVHWF